MRPVETAVLAAPFSFAVSRIAALPGSLLKPASPKLDACSTGDAWQLTRIRTNKTSDKISRLLIVISTLGNVK
jgi:hypothetical protein